MLFVLTFTAIKDIMVKQVSGWLKVNSHVFEHSIETNHPTVSIDDFRVLKTGYRKKKIRRKLSEALLIKQNKRALNKQEAPFP